MDSLLFGRTVDAALNEAGEREAQALARQLSAERDLLLQASPRRRTVQTACAIAEAMTVDIHIAKALDEVDFGPWAGQRFDELQADPSWRRWNEHRDAAVTPSGESIAHVQTRVRQHLDQLHETFPTRTIVLVTHSEVIRSLLMQVLQMPTTAYARMDISPASVSTVLCREGHYIVHAINERPWA
jgi:probable phosphoglycerate mutase